jgi:tetratricopeptide (TPR) repeat protein
MGIPKMTEEIDNVHPEVEPKSSATGPALQSRWLLVALGLLAVIVILALALPGLRNRSSSPADSSAGSLAELEQAALAAPENEALQYKLAGAYYQAGRFEEAWAQLRNIKAYQTAALANPDLPKAEQAVQAAPDSEEAHFKLGTLWARAQLLAPAEIAFQQAIALDAGYTDAHANLGVVYYQMGRLSDALQEFNTALNQHPDDADVHHNKGNVLVQQALEVSPPDDKLLDQATGEFKRALEIDPNLAQAHFGLGAVYFIKNQKPAAIAEFDQFLALDDGSDPAATSAAQSYLQQLKQ